MADVWRAFLPTFGAGKVYPGPVHSQISCKASRQIKKFCLRLFTQSDCTGILFYTHFVPAGFWNRHDNFCGHIYDAFYRRTKKKVFVSFNPGNYSFYSVGNLNSRISNPENRSIPQSLGRSIRNRISGRSILLRFWKRWVFGNGFGRKLAKTFPPSRGPYRFYIFGHRRRTGIHWNNGNRPFVFHFHMERVFDRLSRQRPIWYSFSNRTDSLNRITGLYKPWSRIRPSSHQRADFAFYKHGGIVDAGNDAFCRSHSEYFRTSSKTLMMN